MIFNINLIVDTKEEKIKNNYYNILGSILNLLGENTPLKESIFSINNFYDYRNKNYNISISINGKDNFDKIISIFQVKKEININGVLYKIKGIDFNFKIFDDKIKFNDYNKIEITFKSPTFIKKEINKIDINQLLPVPEVFLVSAIRKYNNLYNKNYNLDIIKKNIKNNIIINRFDILTKTFKIKGNTKAGITGKIKYELLDSIDSDIKIILYNSLKLAGLIGIGTGVRLGLGQVGIYFNNK